MEDKWQSLPEDILLIDKPSGITSFGVVRELRKKLGVKKIGHAGTLDPLATGLMVVGVGPGTKKLTEYIKLPKEYVAEILVGERRSTGDMEGEIVEEVGVEALDEAQVKEELANMIGVLTFPVSAYSAIKKDGVPMYKRARTAAKEGKEIADVPVRDMEVIETALLDIQDIVVNYDIETVPESKTLNLNGMIYHTEGESRAVVTVRFYVGSGTYIRSLAEELGRRLGFPATLKSLRRTKVGEFDIKNARTLSQIEHAQ